MSLEEAQQPKSFTEAKNGIPVDSEGKATTIRVFSFGKPHMRAFHLAWFNFMMCFFATFAPAALMPVIRENLNLTKTDVGLSGVCAVIGAIAGRVAMGSILDTYGSRFGNALVMLWFATPVFLMALVTNAGSFQCVRFFIGIALCCFVCCQFWVGSMFNVRIVGSANAITAGWGNMGGGLVQIVIPAIYVALMSGGVPSFSAWRWTFFVPGGFYILAGLATLMLGIDSPLGDFRDLRKSGVMAKDAAKSAWPVLKCAFSNYRTWVAMWIYGYCFGVELTVDNIIVSYFYDQFGLSLTVAGGLGAMFGLLNLFSRASGGILSDLVAARFGMRGRLWTHWIVQTLGGLFCALMGAAYNSLSATIGLMIIFSILCQQACGTMFGFVPFISRRAYGVVSGTVGAGGNVGAVVTQVIFFSGSVYSPNFTVAYGIQMMGVMIVCCTLPMFLLWFPMWGSMLTSGNPDATEEDYYIKEWTADEISQGLHNEAMKFAMNSKSQRGFIKGAITSSSSGIAAKPMAESTITESNRTQAFDEDSSSEVIKA